MATNQPYLDVDGHFQHPAYVNNDVTIDPRLDTMPGDIAAGMSRQQMVDATFWDPSIENQMAFFDNRIPGGSTDETDQMGSLDAGTTLSTATRTRSPSENSNITPRTRSMTSSRSSVPSAHSASSDQNQKTRKGKQQSTRQRKQSSVSVPSRKNSQQHDPDDLEEDGTKRNRFLERNRVAASKCRQKKKEWVHELEESKQELENRNNNLHLEHNALVAELTRIKNVLMGHAGCHDPNIDQWIDNEARRFVQNTAGKFSTMGAPESLYRVSRPSNRGMCQLSMR